MNIYLMFLPETEEEKVFLNKVYSGIRKDSENHRECLVIDRQNKTYGVSLSFFHHMRGDEEYSTRDISYKEFKLLALGHATGEITLT